MGMGANGAEVLEQMMQAPVQTGAVALLEKLLAMAKRGEIAAVAVAHSAGPGKHLFEATPELAMELHTATCLMETALLSYLAQQAKTAMTRSPLLMPRRA